MGFGGILLQPFFTFIGMDSRLSHEEDRDMFYQQTDYTYWDEHKNNPLYMLGWSLHVSQYIRQRRRDEAERGSSDGFGSRDIANATKFNNAKHEDY